MTTIDYTLIAIASVGRNLELGKDNDLLWSFKADLSRFKRLTLNKVLVMGRKTFESLPDQVRPLPNRISIIVTRDLDYKVNDPNCYVVRSQYELDECIQELLRGDLERSKEVYVIGGSEIYKLLYSGLNELKLTHIDLEDNLAESYFPKVSLEDWKIESTHYELDEPSGETLKYINYVRSFS